MAANLSPGIPYLGALDQSSFGAFQCLAPNRSARLRDTRSTVPGLAELEASASARSYLGRRTVCIFSERHLLLARPETVQLGVGMLRSSNDRGLGVSVA